VLTLQREVAPPDPLTPSGIYITHALLKLSSMNENGNALRAPRETWQGLQAIKEDVGNDNLKMAREYLLYPFLTCFPAFRSPNRN